MAELHLRFPDNAPGSYYVDETCIACGLCEDMAPAVFRLAPMGDHDFVHHQPDTPEQVADAEEARDRCPVEAIGNDGAVPAAQRRS